MVFGNGLWQRVLGALPLSGRGNIEVTRLTEATKSKISTIFSTKEGFIDHFLTRRFLFGEEKKRDLGG